MALTRSSLRQVTRTCQSYSSITAARRWASTSSNLDEVINPSPTPATTAPSAPKPPPSRLLKGVANLLGYTAANSMAVRSTNFYYNELSEQHRRDWDFWYGECKLQRSFQAWFQITNLYLYLLTVRLRSLDKPLGRRFLQELVNHFFIDAEYRMQKDYEIKQSRYIKNTLKTMLAQYHGSTLAYDEGLVGSDAMLAAALWRNLFGAGWGVGMAGVEGKKAPKVAKGSSEVDGPKFEVVEEEDGLPATTLDPATILEREAAFAVVLEKLVRYMRAEVHRLDNLPDQVIANGISSGDTSTVQFGKLSSPVPDAQVETTSTETRGSAPA